MVHVCKAAIDNAYSVILKEWELECIDEENTIPKAVVMSISHLKTTLFVVESSFLDDHGRVYKITARQEWCQEIYWPEAS